MCSAWAGAIEAGSKPVDSPGKRLFQRSPKAFGSSIARSWRAKVTSGDSLRCSARLHARNTLGNSRDSIRRPTLSAPDAAPNATATTLNSVKPRALFIDHIDLAARAEPAARTTQKAPAPTRRLSGSLPRFRAFLFKPISQPLEFWSDLSEIDVARSRWTTASCQKGMVCETGPSPATQSFAA